MRSKYLYEGCSESADHLSRDIFEKHTMYHSKELSFSYYILSVQLRLLVTAYYISPTPMAETALA